MAGLGRGISSLIDESNSKKARQQNSKASTIGQDLLARSRSTAIAKPEQNITEDKVTDKKAVAKKEPASKTTRATKKTVKSDTTDSKKTTSKTTSRSTKRTTRAKVAQEVTDNPKNLSATDNSQATTKAEPVKKTRAKKTSATKKTVSKKVAVENTESEVSSLAKDVALVQSMKDAMELSYIAETGLNDKVSDNQDIISFDSDDHLVLNVKLDMLMPSTYQPRHSFDDEAIRELATSIKEHGLLEPLIVKRIDGGKYEIICGERRYRAARMLGMGAVPCLVREVVDEKAYAIALIENIQRENLNPVELAIAFDQMMQECGMTQEEVAKSVCKSRSAVANYLRVLKLEDGSLAALKAGKIDLGHAKVLLSLSGSAQNEVCQIVIEKGLSVRSTESFVKEFAKKLEAKAAEDALQNSTTSSSDNHTNINYSSYEKALNAKLKGAKAKFKISKDGKGKLTFSYVNDIQLDSLLSLLGLLSDN